MRKSILPMTVCAPFYSKQKGWTSEMINKYLQTTIACVLSLSMTACGYIAAPANSTAEYAGVTESASSDDSTPVDAAICLDYSDGIEAGVYKWILSEDKTYYTLASVDEKGEPVEAEETAINIGANNKERGDMNRPGMEQTGMGQAGMGHGGMGRGGMMQDQGTVYKGVYTSAVITNDDLQRMNIYVPAGYFETDEDGNVTGIDKDAAVGNYTAETAPIVFSNEFGGWRSSQPKSANTDYIREGMIYVTIGGRSRDAADENGNITGKSPTQVVDMKAGIIGLRANRDVIPGDTDKIISVGTSGGGQMSSILGASGNMPEYYQYMYEAGVPGVTENDDGTYSSAYPDDIYAAQAYCPIADIENADLAYAWWWVNLADDGGTFGDGFTEFEIRLQELEADAFIDYLNGLGLTDADGNALTLSGLREGTYYDAILKNLSDALNAMVEAGSIDPEEEYGDHSSWLVLNEDGTYSITDMDEFMIATGLVNNRNKAVPGFDTLDKTAEGDAFGTSEDDVVHFSASVAQILSDNYDELSGLDGFNASEVDDYIDEALEGESAALVETQTNLLNATEIMLGNNGLTTVSPAQHWRIRSGSADQHTSFSVGYNIGLSARMSGLDADYHLVWNMGHGSEEGTSTGTLIEWINKICK